MENRREDTRSTVIKQATLCYDEVTISGVVMDQSDTGAKIQISPEDIHLTPENVQLKYLNEETHNCQRVWKKNNMLGLKYID